MISGLYGAATYGFKGRAELMAAFIMLLGAAVGAQIGTVATKYVKGYAIRVYFGLAVVGCAISVLLKLIGASYATVKHTMDVSATILILSLVSALSLFIFINFLKGVREERRAMKEGVLHV
jgi:drug/metabolite transporter (DMT)-like permease